MSDATNPKPDSAPLMVYQIRIKGHVGPEWTDWFEGMTIMQEDDGETVLTGAVVDQSALYGLLRKVRDLGMSLLELHRVRSDEPCS